MMSEETLDLRGMVCPTTNVKTMEELSKVPSGTLLRIMVDNFSSLEGVMLTAKNAGHEIVQVDQQEGDLVFVITIEKKDSE